MTLSRLGAQITLFVIAAGMIVPLLSIFLASVQPAGSLVTGIAIPAEWHWENYATAWTAAGFATLIRSSLIVAVGVVPLTLALATMTGYALGVLKPKGRHALLTLFVAGLTIPIELVVIPLYFDLRSFGMTNTFTGLILAEIALFMPFSVFWMTTQFQSLPTELVEAASVDGAGQFRMLTQVLLPLLRPGLVTLGLLIFMWSWKQFLLVLVLIQDPAMRTAPAGLGFFVGENTTDIPMLSAGTIIVIVPMLVLYVVFQRSFISGLIQGALK